MGNKRGLKEQLVALHRSVLNIVIKYKIALRQFAEEKRNENVFML